MRALGERASAHHGTTAFLTAQLSEAVNQGSAHRQRLIQSTCRPNLPRPCMVMERYVPASARRHIVRKECVGVYRCIARCVRRAFLCGTGSHSGRDYSHRKAWIIDRISALAGLFGVEVCGYAIMSNPLHLVPGAPQSTRRRPSVV